MACDVLAERDSVRKSSELDLGEPLQAEINVVQSLRGCVHGSCRKINSPAPSSRKLQHLEARVFQWLQNLPFGLPAFPCQVGKAFIQA